MATAERWGTLMAFLLGEQDMPTDWSLTDLRSWGNTRAIPGEAFRCGYCSYEVSSNIGWQTDGSRAFIRICPHCNGPTFFSVWRDQWPGALHGEIVSSLPEEVKAIYREARFCLSVQAYTGSVMLCRKILMNVSVAKGADEGLQFAPYVAWLVGEGYAPKGSEGWVKYIKDRGNEANHEIVPMNKADAIGLLGFTEQLLRNMFELPSLIPPVPAPQSTTGTIAP